MTSKPPPSKRDQFLFVPQTFVSASNSLTEAATKENLQQHLQRRRRTAEASARGALRPAWIEFASTLQSDGVASAQSSIFQIYQPLKNSTDPFNSTAIGSAIRSNLGILHAVFGDIVRGNFLGEAHAPQEICHARKITRHSASIRERLVECVQNEMLMCATLAYALSFRSWSSSHISHMYEVDWYQLRAIKALQAYMQEPCFQINRWLLMSMNSLAITEGWRDMIATKHRSADPSILVMAFVGPGRVGHHIHLNTVLRLIESTGGWSHVEPYVLESLILADKHACFAKNELPMLRPWWDPGPLPDDFKQQARTWGYTVRPMGSSLLLQPCGGKLLEILQDSIDYLQVSDQLWYGGHVSIELESWLSFRLHALQYHLLWAFQESKLSLDRCVSLTALTVLLTSSYGAGLRGGAAWVAKQLYHSLSTSAEEHMCWSHELMIWCLLTGAMASKPGAEQESYLYKLQAIDCAPEVERAEEILIDHMYVKRRQDTQLHSVLQLLKLYHCTQKD